MIAFNGWTNLEQVKAEYPGLVSATIDRVRAEQPAIQYTWSPSGYLEELRPGDNVYWLNLGDHSMVLDGSTGEYDFSSAPPAPFGDRCTDEPCWIGWEVSDIKVVANRTFVAENPSAAALLELVRLPVEDVVAQIVRYQSGEDTEDDLRRHAAEWIAENRDLVDSWLAEARAAGR